MERSSGKQRFVTMSADVLQLRDAPAESVLRARRGILLVEDEVLTRLMVADEFRRRGFNVIEAQNADEAITILRSQVPIGLIFTDIRLPGSTLHWLSSFAKRGRI
jgi:DNA-binding NtrC family response regulator